MLPIAAFCPPSLHGAPRAPWGEGCGARGGPGAGLSAADPKGPSSEHPEPAPSHPGLISPTPSGALPTAGSPIGGWFLWQKWAQTSLLLCTFPSCSLSMGLRGASRSVPLLLALQSCWQGGSGSRTGSQQRGWCVGTG